MQVKGKRLLLNRPQIEKSAIELTPEAQESILKDQFKKWTHLEVYAVGDEITTMKPGDVVMISKTAIESCEIVEIEDAHRLIVNESSVVIIW